MYEKEMKREPKDNEKKRTRRTEKRKRKRVESPCFEEGGGGQRAEEKRFDMLGQGKTHRRHTIQ